jgi:hypothetical protein
MYRWQLDHASRGNSIEKQLKVKTQTKAYCKQVKLHQAFHQQRVVSYLLFRAYLGRRQFPQ